MWRLLWFSIPGSEFSGSTPSWSSPPRCSASPRSATSSATGWYLRRTARRWARVWRTTPPPRRWWTNTGRWVPPHLCLYRGMGECLCLPLFKIYRPFLKMEIGFFSFFFVFFFSFFWLCIFLVSLLLLFLHFSCLIFEGLGWDGRMRCGSTSSTRPWFERKTSDSKRRACLESSATSSSRGTTPIASWCKTHSAYPSRGCPPSSPSPCQLSTPPPTCWTGGWAQPLRASSDSCGRRWTGIGYTR